MRGCCWCVPGSRRDRVRRAGSGWPGMVLDRVGRAGPVLGRVRPCSGHRWGNSVSGLRNPPAAVRGVGAGALAVEAVVLLLAIQPLRVLGARLTGVGVAVMVGLAVAAV